VVVVGFEAVTVRVDALEELVASPLVPTKTALKLWLPIPGTNFSTAVPALVNCAVPRRWVSSQYAAVASQNFTCPVVTAVAPALTLAVKFTTVPDATELTGAPPEDAVSVVPVVAGADLTVAARVVVAVNPPEVPVMVAVEVPAVAELLAVSVSTLVPVVGFGANDAVTPPGSPDAARLTLPLKPFIGMTVIEDVPDAPGSRFTAPGESESAKLCRETYI